MTDDEITVDGRPTAPADGARFEWVDRAAGIARVGDAIGSMIVAIDRDADGTWWVTIRGRRIGVNIRTWRERVLAELAGEVRSEAGPIDIRATLPGMIVAVAVAPGDDVAEGDALATIEAMKMQNEVRAPRAGRIASVGVSAGETVATGALLVRIEDHG